MTPQLEIQIIAMLVAIACALPGVFLVLRRMAMMSDAITHTILLGIVIAFLVVEDLNSPVLIVGATLVGLFTAYLVEKLKQTQLITEDSAIGIVFPLLFSIAILLVSRYSAGVHLDIDAVLLGELAFAPFNRFYIGEYDIGAKAMYIMGIILLINLAFILIFFKELKLVLFDPVFAASIGFSPIIMHYALMTCISLTAVGAFEAVGSILVISFMVGPPITAYLLTDRLSVMLLLSGSIGAVNALIGYHIAMFFDVSIAGTIATVTGCTFLVIFLLSPKRGLITNWRHRRIQKMDFFCKALLFHIMNHELDESSSTENGVLTLSAHLNWKPTLVRRIIYQLMSQGYLSITDDVYQITDQGRAYIKVLYEHKS